MDDRTHALLEQLTTGVAQLTESRSWERYLRFQGRFRDYSMSNVLLIAVQCPSATQVAGYRTWLRLGRQVRKGESAIWILAPLRARRSQSEREEAEDPPIFGFRPVAVFDLAQTEGEPIPEICSRLQGDDPCGHFERLVEVARGIGFRVELANLDAEANGECRFDRRTIRVEQRNSAAQRVKTLAHELGHALLHVEEPDRARAELEAESVAYVVSHVLGIDSGAYSFGYVASWTGGGPAAVASIKSSCRKIQAGSKAILSACEALSPYEAQRHDETERDPGTMPMPVPNR